MLAPAWRVWTYAAPSVVLGCAQRGLLLLHGPKLEPGPGLKTEQQTAQQTGYQTGQQSGLERRVEWLLRESGGGAVLTGPWLVGVSVALPPGHGWLGRSLSESYRPLADLHVRALKAFGVSARALPPQAAGPAAVRGFTPVGWACFGSVSPWEVVDGEGRKLVGMAQRRRKQGVLLVAGTLVGPTDWRLLCEALGQPADAVALRERTVCMQELTRLGGPSQGLAGLQGAQRFAAHLQAALQVALQAELQKELQKELQQGPQQGSQERSKEGLK